MPKRVTFYIDGFNFYYGLRRTRKANPRWGKYYWIAGYYAPYDKHDEESDTWAYEHGYVAVTPLQLDMTAYATMKKLSGLMV